MAMCNVCERGIDTGLMVQHFAMCDDDLAGGSVSSYGPDDGERWDYYTVTLDAGRISYSPVICGDCLIELDKCGHGNDLRHKPSKKRRV